MSNIGEFEDPKIVFTIKLIDAQENISRLLNMGLPLEAAQEMATLLLRMNIPEDEKELLQLREQLTPHNYNSYHDVFEAYFLINSYLNRTYFADYHRAKPRYKEEGKL